MPFVCEDVGTTKRGRMTPTRALKAWERFGKLVTIEQAGHVWRGKIKAPAWLCRCDCGTEKVVARADLKSGRVKSCGCGEGLRHGHHRTPGYYSYRAMISRCLNEKAKDYARYGGAGIRVCARWAHGEEGVLGIVCFFNDMGPRPTPQHSIERVDNQKGYEPGNCVWALPQTQSRNRSNNYFGPGIDPRAVCEENGVNYGTFRGRVSRGASVADALRPSRRKPS